MRTPPCKCSVCRTLDPLEKALKAARAYRDFFRDHFKARHEPEAAPWIQAFTEAEWRLAEAVARLEPLRGDPRSKCKRRPPP